MRYFVFGALGYPALELMWRDRTHPSMALAGGLSASLIHRVNKLSIGLLPKAALCSVGITAIEAGCGMVWNKQHQVWDYRRMPFNWRGQICLPYSIAWGGLSLVLLQLDKVYHKA